ncbi:carbohydrate kinase family protein [Haloarcula sediminis]|uniref:carbohydrate kinase family protein n=1 Tax=Haloarcula sediminis TaxID=3111777 RepID=UPI002D788B2B|nr:carbohydrate kinase family protein [Haloarcula sp. CK38]
MSIVSFGDTALRFATREGERFETAREVGLSVDGISSNAAAVAGRLGADAVWLSKLADTPLGRRAVAELHEHGLETDIDWADPETGRQGLTFHESGAPPRESRLLQDRSDTAMATVSPGDFPVGRIQEADAVFTTGSMAALSDEAAETAGALLRSTPGLRAMDLDFHPGIWSAETAHDTLSDLFDPVELLFASEDGAAAVFDRTGSPRDLVHTIASDYDFSHVVLTRNEYGVVGYHDGVLHEQDAFETPEIDSAGQHAALVGAVLQQLTAGAATDDALAYGAAAAAIARTMNGPLPPIEPADVEELVAAESGGR